MNNDLLARAERAIGYTFHDRELLVAALTHKSYSNAFGGENNERLEFLGDAVLELIISEWLYRKYPEAEEGELTERRQSYVSKTALARLCKERDLMQFLRYAGSTQNLGNKTVESLPEALLGAIYLDGGAEAARKFVARYIVAAETENYRSLLQEYVQDREKKLPVYRSGERDGKFYCTVKALGKEAHGTGTSKKAAETEAAEALYRLLTENRS